MAEYVIYGSEMSPYSVKVRSYCRYKNIPHRWVPRRPENEEAYKRVAKLPIVPTVETPGGEGWQDSTPILEKFEPLFPEPAIHPPGPLGFLSALLEEFGDEWGNKLMFHYRWWAEVDQLASAQTLARLMFPAADEAHVGQVAQMVRARMTGRGHFVGSSQATAPLIASYYTELLDLLSAHLATRNYLFGARPAFADFGLFAQLYEASIDPTCGGIMRARALPVLDWCYRMIAPRNDGAFEDWASLGATLEPVLAYAGRLFLPWSDANAKALEAGAAEFTVRLGADDYVQPPQKYHAKSLAALRAKFQAVKDDAALTAILARTGCLPWL